MEGGASNVLGFVDEWGVGASFELNCFGLGCGWYRRISLITSHDMSRVSSTDELIIMMNSLAWDDFMIELSTLLMIVNSFIPLLIKLTIQSVRSTNLKVQSVLKIHHLRRQLTNMPHLRQTLILIVIKLRLNTLHRREFTSQIVNCDTVVVINRLLLAYLARQLHS